jgi:CheY-like chemotaxis protein
MSHSEPTPVAVLIVDDESLIRWDLVALVEEAGCMAYEAANADEAIRLLERHEEIRVVLTDINMPGSMDGLKLAHYVRGRWPPVKIIVTSGQMKLRREDLPADAAFIGKPYRPEHIRSALRAMVMRL